MASPDGHVSALDLGQMTGCDPRINRYPVDIRRWPGTLTPAVRRLLIVVFGQNMHL
jgi:hypothetical protein